MRNFADNPTCIDMYIDSVRPIILSKCHKKLKYHPCNALTIVTKAPGVTTRCTSGNSSGLSESIFLPIRWTKEGSSLLSRPATLPRGDILFIPQHFIHHHHRESRKRQSVQQDACARHHQVAHPCLVKKF